MKVKKDFGIITIFILIISLIFSSIYTLYAYEKYDYVLIGNTTIWKNNNGNWSELNYINIKRFLFENVYTYNDLNYIGKSFIDYNDEGIEVYDKNYEKIQLSGLLVSIKTNKSYEVKNNINFYDDIGDEDNEYIDEVLNKYSLIQEPFSIFRYIVDLNNDGTKDVVYDISNYDESEENGKSYSIIFSVVNDNIEIMDYVIVDASDQLKEASKSLQFIGDIDNDNNYEFIVLKSYYGSDSYDCYTMYKYDNDSNKYIKLIGC